MKLLFLIRSLHQGGAERQMVNLSKSLRIKGHDVSVDVFYSGGPMDNELTEADVALHPLGKKTPLGRVVFLFFHGSLDAQTASGHSPLLSRNGQRTVGHLKAFFALRSCCLGSSLVKYGSVPL